MRSPVRTLVVLALLVGLLALFLHNVDMRRVVGEMFRARPEWLALSLLTMFVNLALRALRWQYLLEPLGEASFGNAFRATAVGFAANSVLPARAGEVIRPYFLARRENMSATGAFATVIIERMLDLITVLVLLGVFVFTFGEDVGAGNPVVFAAVKWAAAVTTVGVLVATTVLFLMAGNPGRLIKAMTRLEHALPSRLAGLMASAVGKFARGLGIIRRPARLLMALAWSFPLWLSIDVGVWAVAMAFDFNVPFTGSFLIVPLLTLGVAVPTPGAIGGFHEAFRLGATVFYGAPNDSAVAAALVLHVLTIGPVLLLGLLFAAQAGLNIAGMRRLADSAEQGRANV